MSTPNTDRVRWYSLLKPSDVSEEKASTTKKASLLDTETIECNNLVVCKHLEYRTFARFRNYLSFVGYIKGIQPSEKCFHEIIMGDKLQKPYFDLDIPAVDVSSSDGLSLEDSEHLVFSLVESILKVSPKVQPSDIMVFSSHGSDTKEFEDPSSTHKKRSYHIIVDNWCVKTSEANKEYCRLVHANIDPKLSRFIDTTLYKTTQMLRMYNSSKWGSNRIKTLDRTSKWVPQVKADSAGHLYMLELAGSLITNTSYCGLLDIAIPDTSPIYITEATFEQADVRRIVDIHTQYELETNPNVKWYPYSFREVVGKLIKLDRLAPSYCKVCQRVHDRENPYLLVLGKKRDIYFHCRKASKDGRVYIGSLGFEPSKFQKLPPSLDELHL